MTANLKQGTNLRSGTLAKLIDTTINGVLQLTGSGYVTGPFPILSANVGVGSTDISGMLLVEPSAAGTQGLVVKGFTGQPAQLLTIYDSADNLNFNVDVNGNVTVASVLAAGNSGMMVTGGTARQVFLRGDTFNKIGLHLSHSTTEFWDIRMDSTLDGGALEIVGHGAVGQAPNLGLLSGQQVGINLVDSVYENYDIGLYVSGNVSATSSVRGTSAYFTDISATNYSNLPATTPAAWSSYPATGDISGGGNNFLSGGEGYFDQVSAVNDIIAGGDIYTSGGVINFPSGWSIEYVSATSSMAFVYTSG